jgi:hypothetical protein
VAVTLLVAACHHSADPLASSGDACFTAFAVAAGVDQSADSVADLYPAVRACTTIHSWSAAFAAYNGAGFTGTAIEVLTNVCRAPEVSGATLCSLVQ